MVLALLILLNGILLPTRAHVLNYDSVTVCDGVLKEIQCPNNENIHVLQGFYGKWRNHDCHGESVDPDNLPTCREDRAKTTGIVKNFCQGKTTCTLESDKSIYGEPCPDNKAYLYVTFFCLQNGKKLIHHRTLTNEEVVTVPSHGYIIREGKSLIQDEREKKEREKAKLEGYLKLGSPTALNPNPRPEQIENEVDTKVESNPANKIPALNTNSRPESNEKGINLKGESNLLNKLPVQADDVQRVEKKDESLLNDHPLLFNTPGDELKVEDLLKFKKVKQENADTRKLKEQPKGLLILKEITNATIDNETVTHQETTKSNHSANSTSGTIQDGTKPIEDVFKTLNNSNDSNDNMMLINLSAENYKNITNATTNELESPKRNANMSNPDDRHLTIEQLSKANMSDPVNKQSNKSATKQLQDQEAELIKDHIEQQLNKELEDSITSKPTTKSSVSTKGEKDITTESDDSAPDIRSTIICNGESKLIACLPEEGIKVHKAFYGKRSGEDCKGKLPYKDESPTCSALDAKENVQNSCDNKQTCLLFSDENIYGKSLCPLVNKYLHLTYTCSALPANVKTVAEEGVEEMHLKSSKSLKHQSAVSRSFLPEVEKNSTIKICNGENKTISCKKQNGIKINSAFYGKKSGTDCRGDLSYRDDIPECNNPRAFETVRLLCQHQQECELASKSSVFGDDVCPGVNKYIHVEYAC